MELSVLCKGPSFAGPLPIKTLRMPVAALPRSGFLRKALLLMRMTSFLLLAFSLQVSANTYSQKVSIHSQDISLEKVFHELNQQTGYSFFWNGHLLDKVRHLSISVRDVPLKEAIETCLAGTSLSYSILEGEKAVFITPRRPAPSSSPQPGAPADSLEMPADHPVHGTVRDSAGNPLEGASVLLEGDGFSKGMATDKKGQFVLGNVPDGSYTLEVSSIGYAKYVKRISVSLSTPALNVTLNPLVSALDETVVIGYGTQTRRELTASVATVNMSKVAEIASPSINDELGGRMPGVFITTDGGGPGAQASIFVRGGNSGNNPPLFVIDGFIRTQTDYMNINPNDIESFNVLKDAEATAVYGSQGANGVIVITTKRGSYNGKPSFNYSFNQIWTQPTTIPKTISSYQSVLATNQAYENVGEAPLYADSIVQHYKNQDEPYVYPNTNWRALLLKKFAEEDRHDFSMTAGNETLRFYGGLSYYYQGSLLKPGSSDANNTRVTYRMNVENNLKKIGLKITAGLDGYVNNDVQPNSQDGPGYYGVFSHIVDLGPTQLAVNQYGLPYYGTGINPLMETGPQAGYINNNQKTFNGILSLDWQLPFFKDVHLKANGNYNMYYGISKSWNAEAPGYDLNSTTPIIKGNPTLSQTDADGTNLDLQYMATYNHSFGKNHVAFTGVYEYIQGKGDTITAARQGYLINVDQFFAGPTANQQGSGSVGQSASQGYVGRLQYNYDEKYFLEGSMRYDGSYLFPPGKQWGLFDGISAGWILTKEKFLDFLQKDNILDFLKVRGSYGTVGNTNGISPYQYLETYSVNSNAYVVGGTPQLGLSYNGLPGTSYSWYSNQSSNIGVDFSLFRSRLSGSFDYFYYVTKGFVVSDTAYAAPLGTGLPVINSNASQRTAGEEVGINWDDHVGKLGYHIGLTYSHYESLYPIYPGETVTQMENPYQRSSGIMNNYYSNNVGANGSSYLNPGGAVTWPTNGLYTSNGQVLNGPLNANNPIPGNGPTNIAAGDVRYADPDGSGIMTSNDWRLEGSNNFAHANYGINLGLNWKGWSLDAQFMGTGNRDIMLGNVIGNYGLVEYPFQLNTWSPTNTGAFLPRNLPSQDWNNGNNWGQSNSGKPNNEYWLVSVRYFRLKSLNLAYDLKNIAALRKLSFFNSAKLFVTGRNLFTLSNSMKYYIDPESDPNGWAYGVQRTFAVGCNLGF
jgi:TonB-linked SusC/RagA family outer membrane protein